MTPSMDTMTVRTDAGRIAFGSLLYITGSAIQYLTPAYLAELSSRLGFNEAQLGSIAAADNMGIGIASLLGMLWLTRADRRWAVAGAALASAVLNIGVGFCHEFQPVLVIRFLNGLMGEGILFSLAFLVLGATRDPGRSFGIALTAVVSFGSLVLAASPQLNRIPFGSGTLLPLVFLCVVTVVLAPWTPNAPAAVDAPIDAGKAPSVTGNAVIALAAMLIWFAAPGAFWTFAETDAAARQVRGSDIATALALGNAVGLLGSLAAAWQGNRWGRSGPVIAATVGLSASALAYEHSVGLPLLVIILSGFNIFWNYAAVYQMAHVAMLDTANKVSVAISAAQVFGFALGGLIAGLLIVRLGFGVLAAVAAALSILGLLVFLTTLRSTPLQAVGSEA